MRSNSILSLPILWYNIGMIEKKQSPQEKYDKKTARYYRLKLNIKTDKPLIEKLDSVENVQGYIKSLISDDLKKGL